MKGQFISALQRLTNGATRALGIDDRGSLRTASEPWTGFEKADVSGGDLTYTSATGFPRSIRATAAGNIKVDCLKGDGTAQTGLVIAVTDFENLPLGGVTKIYQSGTTATGLFAGY